MYPEPISYISGVRLTSVTPPYSYYTIYYYSTFTGLSDKLSF